MGRERLKSLFDVEAISINTILERLRDAETQYKPRIKLQLTGHFVKSGSDLLVGSVRLTDLYGFLKEFRDQTQDLDQLYERTFVNFSVREEKLTKRSLPP